MEHETRITAGRAGDGEPVSHGPAFVVDVDAAIARRNDAEIRNEKPGVPMRFLWERTPGGGAHC